MSNDNFVTSEFLDNLRLGLENIDGVGHVEIKELGGSIYSVNVSMETFEFSSYEKVIEKELELMKTIPDSTFNFNVTFASGSTVSTASAVHFDGERSS